MCWNNVHTDPKKKRRCAACGFIATKRCNWYKPGQVRYYWIKRHSTLPIWVNAILPPSGLLGDRKRMHQTNAVHIKSFLFQLYNRENVFISLLWLVIFYSLQNCKMPDVPFTNIQEGPPFCWVEALSVIIKRVKMWAATKIVSSRLGLAWVYSFGDGCILYKSKHV